MREMHRKEFGKAAALVIALFAVMAVTGGSSKLPYTWRNPAYAGGTFTNILVLAMNGQSEGRADFEDRMVMELTRPGVQAVPSYSLLPRPNSTPINMDNLKEIIGSQKFDAVVVSRLVKYKKTVTYVPGQAYPLYPYYGTLYGYYSVVSPVVYSPGYLQKDTSAQVETNFYSTAQPDGQLVWTGTSYTVNPRSMDKAIDAVVKLLVQALEKEKII
jgi:hypothetical protein